MNKVITFSDLVRVMNYYKDIYYSVYINEVDKEYICHMQSNIRHIEHYYNDAHLKFTSIEANHPRITDITDDTVMVAKIVDEGRIRIQMVDDTIVDIMPLIRSPKEGVDYFTLVEKLYHQYEVRSIHDVKRVIKDGVTYSTIFFDNNSPEYTEMNFLPKGNGVTVGKFRTKGGFYPSKIENDIFYFDMTEEYKLRGGEGGEVLEYGSIGRWVILTTTDGKYMIDHGTSVVDALND